MSTGHHGPLEHQVVVHGSDEEFLAAVVPFLRAGIAAEDEPPPLLVSTARKMDLVRDEMGADREHVAFIPNHEWYTGTAANAMAHAAGYIAMNTGPAGRIHAAAEPDWTGRAGSSPREITEWIRFEAMANVLLAPFGVHAMCPYDTRTTDPAIVEAARSAHPIEVLGTEKRVCATYENPLSLIAKLDAKPLPKRPKSAKTIHLHRDVESVCRFVRAQAILHGLGTLEAGVFESAVAEVAHLAGEGYVHTWSHDGASVCEIHRLTGKIDDLLIGFRPPRTREPQPGQGLWFTRQVCEYVDVRSGPDGWTIRMQSVTRH
ncbi:hypothetical protein FKR81_38575 [Lentzea tibetensis]|uniref:MEDS domain-containing protein n=1 Tax=Lentzea tibetensis TaxID=2591470 RepID=A0A563EH64_9PSEU|nr:MEDS domain-containing protein [Lentzea tibetensis]TWP45739.1 hypothetical protein FKR81_38575 [Lentzea tibetensis]